MTHSSVPNTRLLFRSRATTATGAMNPALVAYIVYMLSLTATVIG